jgi:hypothetical protein
MRAGEVCRVESEFARIMRPHIEALGKALAEGNAPAASMPVAY